MLLHHRYKKEKKGKQVAPHTYDLDRIGFESPHAQVCNSEPPIVSAPLYSV